MSRKYQQQGIPNRPKHPRDTPKPQRDPLNLDHVNEMSEFGAQVIMLFATDSARWTFSYDRRVAAHPDVGGFVVDTRGKVTHQGVGSMDSALWGGLGGDRVLTGEDQRLILDEIKRLMTSGVATAIKETKPTAGVMAAAQAPVQVPKSVFQQLVEQQPMTASQQRSLLDAYKDHMVDAQRYGLIGSTSGALRNANPLVPVKPDKP